MGKIVLSFPKKFFKQDFLDIEVEKGLGVRGDALPNHLKENIRVDKRETGLFSKKLVYCCTSVNENVVLVGTTV